MESPLKHGRTEEPAEEREIKRFLSDGAKGVVEASECVSKVPSPSLPNPHLAELKVDYLYHLGLDTAMDLQGMFGDVKYVCMGGSNERMHTFAEKTKAALGLDRLFPVGTSLSPIGKPERYHLYKVGPVICVSHGMGMPSISILLHELAKLMVYAKVKDYVFIRIGTAGGVGIAPGTVVLSTRSLNTSLEPFHETRIFGKVIRTPTLLSEKLNAEILKCKGNLDVITGETLCTSDFYEEQGRMDGFFCDFDREHRTKFLAHVHALGVTNIEMESEAFSSFCYRAKIPAAIACGILVNRMQGDQVTSTSAELARYSENAITLVLNYIKSKIDQKLDPLAIE